jgi:hypothetical protein
MSGSFLPFDQMGRRGFLKSAGLMSLGATALGSSLLRATAARAESYEAAKMVSVGQIEDWLEMLNTRFGPQRYTGNPNHVAYVDWLTEKFTSLGCSITTDTYTFERWDANMTSDLGASVSPSPGHAAVPLDVTSYYPYSGSTLTTGPVTGNLIYVPITTAGQAPAAATALVASPPQNLASCVVAFECPCPDSPAATTWGVYPPNLQLETPYVSQPYMLIFAGLSKVITTLNGKCKGILFIWTNVSDQGAKYQYLFGGFNFLVTTPALFVGPKAIPLLKSAAASAGTVTMKLNAKVFPNTPTKTIIATLPGSNPNEIITVGSHTDGANVCEENGALGVLAVAKYASTIPIHKRNRTLAFVCATGHFAGSALTNPNTATSPIGTLGADAAGAFNANPQIASKAVAVLAMEHLGAMEWKDDGFNYRPTGLPTADNWYIGSQATGNVAPDAANQVMANVTLAGAQGIEPKLMRMQVEKSGQSSPESAPAISRGIPSMGLIPLPSYLLAGPPNGCIDKISVDRWHAQVKTITKMYLALDQLSAAQINGTAAIPPGDL